MLPRLLPVALLGLVSACGGDDGPKEDLVVQTPVQSNPGDSGATDTADTGVPADTGDTSPTGPHWSVVTLSGGAATSPDQTFEGDSHTFETGDARLFEDASGFKLELHYTGMVGSQGYSARCYVPFDFVGAMYPESDQYGDSGLSVGCPAIAVGPVDYDQYGDGLTTVTINDGSTVHGTFELNVRSADGYLLVSTGEFHFEACEGFWGGTPCSF